MCVTRSLQLSLGQVVWVDLRQRNTEPAPVAHKVHAAPRQRDLRGVTAFPLDTPQGAVSVYEAADSFFVAHVSGY